MISRSVVYHVDTEKEADMSAEALTWLYPSGIKSGIQYPMYSDLLGDP